MGIWIYCDEKEYSCNYSSWDKFRMATIDATFNYIKSHAISTECEREQFYVNKLLEIINNIAFYRLSLQWEKEVESILKKHNIVPDINFWAYQFEDNYA